jgi:hypothetical protein
MITKEMETAKAFLKAFEDNRWAEAIHLFIEDLQVRSRITSGYDIPFTDYSSIQFVNLFVYSIPDPNLILAEYRLKAMVEETGESYNKEHLAVFKFKEGKILRFVQFNRERRVRSLSAPKKLQ